MVIKLKRRQGVWDVGSQHFPREYVNKEGSVTLSFSAEVKVDHSTVRAYVLQDVTFVGSRDVEVLVP